MSQNSDVEHNTALDMQAIANSADVDEDIRSLIDDQVSIP